MRDRMLMYAVENIERQIDMQRVQLKPTSSCYVNPFSSYEIKRRRTYGNSKSMTPIDWLGSNKNLIFDIFVETRLNFEVFLLLYS